MLLTFPHPPVWACPRKGRGWRSSLCSSPGPPPPCERELETPRRRLREGFKKKLESFTLTVGKVLKPKIKMYFAASPYQGGFDPNVQNPTLNFFFFWAFPNLIASDIRPDWEHWGQLLTVQIFVMGAAPLTQWLACYSLMLTFVSVASCGL